MLGVDPDAPDAELLAGGGRLAVFWNAFQPPPGLGDAFAEVYRQVMPGSPLLWQGPFPSPTRRCVARHRTGYGKQAR